MANLSVISDLTKTPLTRQDIHDAWTTAALGSIVKDDLATGFLSVTVATSFSGMPSEPQPGDLMWVADEQTMFCWHDEVDDTGVSLWLAIGPDVFETACLLMEPAWPGSLMEPYIDRWVAPVAYTASLLGDGVNNRMIGNVHSGVPYPLNSRTPETLASGTWVRVGIDGFLYGWLANASGVSQNIFVIQEQKGVTAAPIDAVHLAGATKGALIKTEPFGAREGVKHPYLGYCGHSLYTLFNGTTPSTATEATAWGWHFRYRFTGFKDFQDRTP
jgi:hypothetical protein